MLIKFVKYVRNNYDGPLNYYNAKRNGHYTLGVHYFQIIQWTGVNYSANTTVTTPQNIVQMKICIWFCSAAPLIAKL